MTVYDKQTSIISGETGDASFCASGQTNQTAYIAVFADPSATGDYTLGASSYNAFIDYTQPFPQISDSVGPGKNLNRCGFHFQWVRKFLLEQEFSYPLEMESTPSFKRTDKDADWWWIFGQVNNSKKEN